jgi:hypothetical protein
VIAFRQVVHYPKQAIGVVNQGYVGGGVGVGVGGVGWPGGILHFILNMNV